VPFVLTRTEPIAKLLFEDQLRHWQIALVADRRQLLAMVADLHERGVARLRLNPTVDGRCGG
jgi:hypothetical protein